MSRIENKSGARRLDNEFRPAWVSNSYDRGHTNEKRALAILQLMADEGMIGRVKRATKKQNTDGIDLWVYIGEEDNKIRIPLQVKSSEKAAKDYMQKLRRPHEIAVVVVNEKRSNREIKRKLRRDIILWLQHNRAGMAEVVNAPV